MRSNQPTQFQPCLIEVSHSRQQKFQEPASTKGQRNQKCFCYAHYNVFLQKMRESLK